MKEIPDNSIDLIITDPPYYNQGSRPKYSREGHNDVVTHLGEWDKFENDEEFLDFIKKAIVEMARVLKDNGSMYIFCNDRYNSYLRKFIRESENMKFASTIIWHKYNSPPRFIEKAGFISSKEIILFCYKGKNPTFNKPKEFKDLLDVWISPMTSTEERLGHPTQKPEFLMEKLIAISSNEKDLVLDPFIGSGTTAAACMNLNRDYIGMEIDPEFFGMAQKRLNSIPIRLESFLKNNLNAFAQKITTNP
jgi:site-specific DNA-methyltransferase (adenine-specific)